MVEGPAYKRIAEFLQVLVGKRFRQILRAQSWEGPTAVGVRALAAVLPEFVGRRLLRVLVVGKEIFLIFEHISKNEQEDDALKLHFGDDGRYSLQALRGEPVGPGGAKRRPEPELRLQFDEYILGLWEDHVFFAHRYEVVSSIRWRKAESRCHRDICADSFDWDDACIIIRSLDDFVVDAIVDQSLLPGVGNKIKVEGLFESRIHPLRKCKDLSDEEVRGLLHNLRQLASAWYSAYKQSDDRSEMNPSVGGHLMRCNGASHCARCQQTICMIKIGAKKRITYFCPSCQALGQQVVQSRAHRHRKLLHIPNCSCGDIATLLHVNRPGVHYGRPFFTCARRKHIASSSCDFFDWLDNSFTLPSCECAFDPKPMVVRRVMGLRDNGRWHARCASRRCKHRIWLDFAHEESAPDATRGSLPDLGELSETPETSGDEAGIPGLPSGAQAPEQPPQHSLKQKRWIGKKVALSTTLLTSGAAPQMAASSGPSALSKVLEVVPGITKEKVLASLQLTKSVDATIFALLEKGNVVPEAECEVEVADESTSHSALSLRRPSSPVACDRPQPQQSVHRHAGRWSRRHLVHRVD